MTLGLLRLAGCLGLHLLGQGLAVLGGEFDCGDGGGAAEIRGVSEVALGATEEGEAEIADRSVGYDGNIGLNRPVWPRLADSAPGMSMTWPSTMKAR